MLCTRRLVWLSFDPQMEEAILLELRMLPFCLPSRVHSLARLLPPRTARRLSERRTSAGYSSRSSVYGRIITLKS